MLDLISKRERTRVLLALAMALGSTSAVLSGTFAAFTYGTHGLAYVEAQTNA